jgi:hypothetical protein
MLTDETSLFIRSSLIELSLSSDSTFSLFVGNLRAVALGTGSWRFFFLSKESSESRLEISYPKELMDDEISLSLVRLML